MDKFEKRAMKMAAAGATTPTPVTGPIHCACVIHGDAYSWDYVERLYNMLNRHVSVGIVLHVYTEASRSVPAPMVKHVLEDWGIGGHRRGWWYKMQLFNSGHYSGPLLYFDLDVVIVNNIDRLWNRPLSSFWSVRDFKYLWRPTSCDVNSSIMWWDTAQFDWVWKKFQKENMADIIRKYHGDQNYINDLIAPHQRNYFDINHIKSWRWQCLDGGYDFRKKYYLSPGAGTQIPHSTTVLVFHGKPKPTDIQDPVVLQHWK